MVHDAEREYDALLDKKKCYSRTNMIWRVGMMSFDLHATVIRESIIKHNKRNHVATDAQ